MRPIEAQTAADGVAEVAFRYSVDELAALAGLAGAASFPGTAGYRIEPPDARRAARRALVARGTISVSADGTAAIDPAQRAVLACALRPGAEVSIRHAAAGAVTTRIAYVTRQLSVLHAELGGGIHRLAAFPTAALPRRVAWLVGLEARDGGAGEPLPLSATALEGMRAGNLQAVSVDGLRDDVRSASSLAVVRQAGKRVTAGEIVWLDAGEAGLRIADAANGSPTLVPVAAAGIVDRLRLLLE